MGINWQTILNGHLSQTKNNRLFQKYQMLNLRVTIKLPEALRK
jgi:hypothetical protein